MSVYGLVAGVLGFGFVLWLGWISADATFAWQSRRFAERQQKARALAAASKALARKDGGAS